MKENKLRIILVMLCAFGALALQAQKNVTGTVVDQSGAGLPGVSILVKGTTKGTTTDVDGKFGICTEWKCNSPFYFFGIRSS